MKSHCVGCPFLDTKLDDKGTPYCRHPLRPWQDMVRVDGYPLTGININNAVWSECRFGFELPYVVFELPQKHLVFLPRDHAEAEKYRSMATREVLTRPPMLSSGTILDGDFAGYTFDDMTNE